MTAKIDLNSDLGEHEASDAIARDIEIMNLVSSVNIACGGHAGNEATMSLMLKAARQRRVAVGAHPSYPDRENFGRTTMKISPEDLYDELCSQIDMLVCFASAESMKIDHVKPHGALYNDAADDKELANVVAHAAATCIPGVAIVGLSGGAMRAAARKYRLPFVAEAFADRRYDARGRLVTRDQEDALIEDEAGRVAQALALASRNRIEASGGDRLKIRADSICLHSDTDGALESAHAIRKALDAAGISVAAPV